MKTPASAPPRRTVPASDSPRSHRLSTEQRLERLAQQKRELETLERELKSAQREEHARLLRRRGAQIVRTVAGQYPELDVNLESPAHWLRAQPGARTAPTAPPATAGG